MHNKEHLPKEQVKNKNAVWLWTIDGTEKDNNLYYEGKLLGRASSLLYNTIGRVMEIDYGKRVYYNPLSGHISIESNEQRDERIKRRKNK